MIIDCERWPSLRGRGSPWPAQPGPLSPISPCHQSSKTVSNPSRGDLQYQPEDVAQGRASTKPPVDTGWGRGGRQGGDHCHHAPQETQQPLFCSFHSAQQQSASTVITTHNYQPTQHNEISTTQCNVVLQGYNILSNIDSRILWLYIYTRIVWLYATEVV